MKQSKIEQRFGETLRPGEHTPAPGRLGDREGEKGYLIAAGVAGALGLFVILSIVAGLDRRTLDQDQWRMLGILAAGLFGIPGGLLAIIYWKMRDRVSPGVIKLGNGATYGFKIGDTLSWYDTPVETVFTGGDFEKEFRGIEVELPVSFPHIYLDTRRTLGRMNPYYIPESQRLNLEGNFPQTYHLYAPGLQEVDVLALLQPDVMEKLQQLAGSYDIEIYQNKLRLIGSKRLNNHPDRQEALIELAVKLCEAIERRIGIMERQKLKSAKPLIIYRYHGVKLFSKFIPLWYIPVCFVLGLLLLFLWFGEIYLFIDGETRGVSKGFGVLTIISILPLIFLILATRQAFGRPKVG